MRILLVDDHQTFLAGTAMILEKHGFGVTTAASGQAALELLKDGAYDLCLFDLKLPGMNGFELTEQALALHPEARVVILTGEDLADHYDRLIELGASGMLEKSLGEPEFVASIRLAAQGLVVLPLPLAKRLRSKPSGTGNGGGATAGGLTDKELDVLKLIAGGAKNKDIADKLFMSQRNVEYIISNLFEKLQVSSRQDVVARAIEKRFLKLEL